MRKLFSLFLFLLIMLSLCACGLKKQSEPAAPTPAVVETPAPTPIPTPTPEPEPLYYEVEITLDNLFDYYTFVEDPSYTYDEEGEIDSMLVNTKLVLKDGIFLSDEQKSLVGVDYSFLMKVYAGADNYYDGGRKDDFIPDYEARTFQHGLYIIYQHDYEFTEHDEGAAEIPLYYYTYMSSKQIELPEQFEYISASGTLYVMK